MDAAKPVSLRIHCNNLAPCIHQSPKHTYVESETHVATFRLRTVSSTIIHGIAGQFCAVAIYTFRPFKHSKSETSRQQVAILMNNTEFCLISQANAGSPGRNTKRPTSMNLLPYCQEKTRALSGSIRKKLPRCCGNKAHRR